MGAFCRVLLGEDRLRVLCHETRWRCADRSHKKTSPLYRLSPLVLFALFFSPAAAQAIDNDIEQDIQKNLKQSKILIEQINTKLRQGASITSEVAQLRKAAESVKASSMLLDVRLKLREEKAKTLGPAALARQQAMTADYKAALTEYLSIIDGLPPDNSLPSSTIETLRSFFNKILPAKKQPIIGSLPYKHLNLPSQTPSTAPSITPAYFGGNKTVSPDDTVASPEAPISPEIAALAQSLNWNSVSIYEYVKNNVDTEWYWGCMKGAVETLYQKSGNDCDQATLLTALLRASGFPTRYVRGTVQFFPDIERAKNLTGVDDPAKIAEYFQKAGVPYKPVIEGGKIANLQIEHIWVESQIPYSNYRGAIIDVNGKTWLGLDTSIKVKGYTYNNAPDVLSSMSLSTARDEYLGFITTGTGSTPFELNQTPLEFLQTRITEQLTISQPTATYSDFLRTRTLIPEVLNILPASTQFTLIKATNEYIAIPDELIHKVRFHATTIAQPETSLFDITLPSYELSNQQIAMSYEPETVQDQEVIDSFNGLDNTPAYLVRLRPVLKVNGNRVVVAESGLPMGTDYNLTIELQGPGHGSETITNTHIVGNMSAIGIVAQESGASRLTAGQQGKDAEQLLFEETQRYVERWNRAEDELASLFQLVPARPIPTIVTIGGLIDVTELMGMPHGFTWKGVFVDADMRAIEPVQSSGSGDQGERQKLFAQLAAMQGSVLEHRVLEDDFQVESISTAKLFQLVNQGAGGTGQGSGLLSIDKSNVASVLPSLAFDENIKDDITNAVNQNLIVRIPQSEITYKDWTGIGYLKENSDTFESGWMLSGMIAGAVPVTDVWLNRFLQYTLSNPYTGPTNTNPLSAARILKIPVTDNQPAQTVGTALSQPLAVVILDSNNKPVVGASVTFTIIAGKGSFDSVQSTVTTTATTDQKGMAKTPLILGIHTAENRYYLKLDDQDKYYTQVGLNLVTASVTSGSGNIFLDQPFEEYGKPGQPTQIKKILPLQDPIPAIPNTPGGSLQIAVNDDNGNPVSNVKVAFQVQEPQSSLMLPSESQGFRNLMLMKPDACQSPYPLYDDCAAVAGKNIDDLVTDYTGVMVYTIVGNAMNTLYMVNVTSPQITPTPQNPALVKVTFSTTSYRKTDGMYMLPTLFIQSLEIVNDKGEPINASKAGGPLKAPFTAELFLLEETKATMEAYPDPNHPGQYLWRIIPSNLTSLRKITNGSVTFTAKTGGGSATPVLNLGNGQYLATYTTGSVPAINTIKAVGSATITVPQIRRKYCNSTFTNGVYTYTSCGETEGYSVPGLIPDPTQVYTTDILPAMTATVQTGYSVYYEDMITPAQPAFTDTAWVDEKIIGQYEKSVLYTVYGLGVSLDISPQLVLLSDSGYTTADMTFKYNILPPEYNAAGADVDIFTADLINDAWAGYLIGDKTQGQGSAGFVQGTSFDINKLYKAQVVLNRGSDSEVRGEKKEILVAQMSVKKDQSLLEADEIKFGDGSRPEKKYYLEFLSRALLKDCASLTGTISIINNNGQTITVPGAQDEYFLSEYPLDFPEAIVGGCKVRIKDMTDNANLDQYVVVSNKPRSDLDGGLLGNPALWDTTVLYGGIGNTFKIEVNGAAKFIPIEPLAVIVLGIDGLRQDVLYKYLDDTALTEAAYNDPNGCGGNCYVPTVSTNLPGLSQIITDTGSIKLKKVTAIFPSITFASWASIFTGKLPNETGILGNEFFARDLYQSGTIVPGMESLPLGMVSLDADGGAFRPLISQGPYSWYDATKSIPFALGHVMPAEFAGFSNDTLEKKLGASAPLKVISTEPLWNGINDLVKSKYSIDTQTRCDQSQYECRTVSMFNQYTRGADWWGTPGSLWSTLWTTIDNGFDGAKIFDTSSTNEAVDFINNYFVKTTAEGKRKRFPAVFSVYLPGLDHDAHVHGMGNYIKFFTGTTDAKIQQIVTALKAQDEFDNKIFIITADHGHTAMPIFGTITLPDGRTIVPDTSCKLNVNNFNRKNVQDAELANNNLHIWELAEIMKELPTGEVTPEGKATYYKILAPSEIVAANKGETTTNDPNSASIIAALNGPMAHLYVKGVDGWNSDPQSDLLIKVADLLQASLSEGDGPIPRLSSSVEAILIRPTRNSDYVVYNGSTINEAGQITLNTFIPLTTYFSDGTRYIDALNRINGMDHPNRSGDLVLIMKDATTGGVADRYTTGVACKSWHGRATSGGAEQPIAPRLRLFVITRVHQREERQRGVAQPTVPIVPVARPP